MLTRAERRELRRFAFWRGEGRSPPPRRTRPARGGCGGCEGGCGGGCGGCGGGCTTVCGGCVGCVP